MQELQTGCLLQGGKYRIERKLGQGGFGITYEGLQTVLNRRVAIKEFFMKDYCNRQDAFVAVATEGSRELVADYRQKFIKEAQTIARMEDLPNIVRIHDIFEENGTAYYVMDFVPGGSLMQHVTNNGPLPERRAIEVIGQLGQALSQLHRQNTLHLDIKPDNILLGKQGQPILIDFGVSKHYDQSGSQTSSTPAGLSRGYAPLEQYQMGGLSLFTPATDVYSLGATLLFLLTGKTPPDANIILEEGMPARPSAISESTWHAIVQAMQPRKRDRVQSVDQFLQLLSAPKPHISPTPQHAADRFSPSLPTEPSVETERASSSSTVDSPASAHSPYVVMPFLAAAVATLGGYCDAILRYGMHFSYDYWGFSVPYVFLFPFVWIAFYALFALPSVRKNDRPIERWQLWALCGAVVVFLIINDKCMRKDYSELKVYDLFFYVSSLHTRLTLYGGLFAVVTALSVYHAPALALAKGTEAKVATALTLFAGLAMMHAFGSGVKKIYSNFYDLSSDVAWSSVSGLGIVFFVVLCLRCFKHLQSAGSVMVQRLLVLLSLTVLCLSFFAYLLPILWLYF